MGGVQIVAQANSCRNRLSHTVTFLIVDTHCLLFSVTGRIRQLFALNISEIVRIVVVNSASGGVTQFLLCGSIPLVNKA